MSICARKLKILKGHKSDGCSKKTSVYIICLVMFTFLEGLMLDAVFNPVFRWSKQLVKSSKLVVVHGSKDRIFVVTLISKKMKIHSNCEIELFFLSQLIFSEVFFHITN